MSRTHTHIYIHIYITHTHTHTHTHVHTYIHTYIQEDTKKQLSSQKTAITNQWPAGHITSLKVFYIAFDMQSKLRGQRQSAGKIFKALFSSR